ncbi:hypothetical protein [Bradyrhizobium hereditatis]|uniref:hypothetical protein n=1 Tax=Bradyrhizobium hereditatis TaxID=2821405 RepID=UPI00289A74A7|nr:hypothetical protein [Bradyrhizobium hereditatis]
MVLIGGADAFAQGSSSVSKNSGSGGGGGVMQAPVGHRQPRPSDLPNEGKIQPDPNDPLSKENAALDRKIKSICRGC